jgi:uncharacterized protein YjbI with pentapeptide repeats
VVFEDRAPHVQETFTALKHQGSRLVGIEFDGCTFDHCNFARAVLSDCRFTSCRFVACDLSAMQVIASRFRDLKVEKSKLLGIDWTKADGMDDRRAPTALSFSECILDLSSFFGLNLRGAVIERCSSREVNFTEADMRDAVCAGTDFDGATFHRTDLEGADLRGALNYAIDPRLNKVKGGRFSLPEAIALLRGLDVVID